MVVALAGRRIDAEDANPIRFPLDRAEKVKEKLHRFFMANKTGCLVCSGACGADLIALDVAGQSGINRKMVLPFEAETFRSTSVIDRPGNWGVLFDTIHKELNKEQNVIILNYTEDDKNAYEKTNFEILKTADAIFNELKQQGKQSVDSGVEKKVAMIIWEGIPKDSNDTTDHFRKEAMKRGYDIEEINCLN